MKTHLACFAALLGTVLCSGASAGGVEPKRLSEAVRILASEEFEGRAPGTEGETETIDYLVESFRSLGLAAGGTNGSWTEERGLIGSQAYASNPVYPLPKTVANLTLDVLQTAGLSRDVLLVGAGQSELEDDLARAAKKQDRTITPETLPERGLFYRADHFSLARQGVPVLLLMALSGAPDLREGGRAAGEKWLTDYMRCYHQTCDLWDANWDLRGAAQDVELFHTIAGDLANSRAWPQWRTDSEFHAIRERSRQERRP